MTIEFKDKRQHTVTFENVQEIEMVGMQIRIEFWDDGKYITKRYSIWGIKRILMH